MDLSIRASDIIGIFCWKINVFNQTDAFFSILFIYFLSVVTKYTQSNFNLPDSWEAYTMGHIVSLLLPLLPTVPQRKLPSSYLIHPKSLLERSVNALSISYMGIHFVSFTHGYLAQKTTQ